MANTNAEILAAINDNRLEQTEARHASQIKMYEKLEAIHIDIAELKGVAKENTKEIDTLRSGSRMWDIIIAISTALGIVFGTGG